MTNLFVKQLCTVLIGTVILSSCSRPVAYFQRSPVEPATLFNTQTAAISTPTQAILVPTETLTPANDTSKQLDIYARTDSRLVANKKLSKRMDRERNLLATSFGVKAATGANTPRKMNMVERLMLKKVNKQINRQLAPTHPEKAMLSRGYLIGGGAVLLIGGLLLLIIGTGTAAFIGLIIALIGAVGLILALFGY
ncbi:hypothetical protein GCM10028808_59520 [Spirosoma migulaei]